MRSLVVVEINPQTVKARTHRPRSVRLVPRRLVVPPVRPGPTRRSVDLRHHPSDLRLEFQPSLQHLKLDRICAMTGSPSVKRKFAVQRERTGGVLPPPRPRWDGSCRCRRVGAEPGLGYRWRGHRRAHTPSGEPVIHRRPCRSLWGGDIGEREEAPPCLHPRSPERSGTSRAADRCSIPRSDRVGTDP